jgi:hypothetical protein
MGDFILFFQFCDVARVAIIHKRKEPNLAAGQRGEQNFFRILLYFGDLQELIV